MREGRVQATLGDVAHITIGRTPPRDDPRYWTDHLERPFCTIADMDGPRVRPQTEGVSALAELEGKAKRVPAGALLMSFKLTIGRVGFADVDVFPNEAIAWIEPTTRDLDRRYLALWLQHGDLTQDAGRAVKGHTLNSASLRAITVEVPPLAEQCRIVDLVWSADSANQVAAQLSDRARASANAVRNAWFGRPSHHRVALAEAVEVTNGRLRSPKNATGPWMTRYVRAANVQDGQLVLDAPMYMNFSPQEQVKFALTPGDVLVTEGSGSRGSIGASCRWNGEIPGTVCFQNHLLRLRAKPAAGVSAAYILQWALWTHRSGRFAEIATGTNILSLGVERVEQMPLPLGDDDERRSFLDLVSTLDQTESSAAAYRQGLARLRTGLLDALLSGQHPIPDSYDRFVDAAS